MKKQLNVRIPNITRRQLDAIADREQMTIGEVVTMATDRLYRLEFYEQDRVTQVNQIRELAANIADNLGEGTAAELVEYALSDEGRESWGIGIELDTHDRGLLERFVGESLGD